MSSGNFHIQAHPVSRSICGSERIRLPPEAPHQHKSLPFLPDQVEIACFGFPFFFLGKGGTAEPGKKSDVLPRESVCVCVFAKMNFLHER